MKAYELDVNVPKMVLVGTVSVLLLAIILIGTHGYFLKLEKETFAAKNYDATHPQLDEVNKAANLALHSYKWVDKNSGTVQLPIDEAIKVMAATKGKPPTTQPLGPS